MGAVLNGIELAGAYQYYAYYQDYAAEDEMPAARLIEGSESTGTLPAVRRSV